MFENNDSGYIDNFNIVEDATVTCNSTIRFLRDINISLMNELAIFFDIIGMLSFTIPGIGELSDVVWAPLSVYLLTKMYKGVEGKEY